MFPGVTFQGSVECNGFEPDFGDDLLTDHYHRDPLQIEPMQVFVGFDVDLFDLDPGT